MYECVACTYSTNNINHWRRHIKAYPSHSLVATSVDTKSDSNSSSSSDEAEATQPPNPKLTRTKPKTVNSPDIPIQGSLSPRLAQIFDVTPISFTPMPSPEPPTFSSDQMESDEYYPFNSRLHFQLCLLYHGSYRRNFDLTILQGRSLLYERWS